MNFLKRQMRSLLERTLGVQIVRLASGKSFALVSNRSPSDAWFSLDLQLQRLIRTTEIDLVIDVGANEGQFARALRRHYKGDIVSFEPVGRPFGILSAQASRDPKWRTCQYAIGNKECEETIHVSDFTVFSSLLQANSFCRATFGEQSAGLHEERVQVRRLDNCLAALIPDILKRRIFLKLDTQGYDLQAFSGLGMLAANVSILQSEVSLRPLYDGMPHWTESIATYERAGFRVSGLFPVVYEGESVIEYDCILTRVP